MTPRITIRRADATQRALFDAMAARYFAEVIPDGPSYVPVTLDAFWRDAGKYPYLIEENGTPVGFALVWTYGDGTHELSEFTIDPAHRHKGIGTIAATLIFEALGGDWTMGVVRHPAGAMDFWLQCLSDTPHIHDVTRGPARTEHQIGSLSFRVAQ